ncbi:MAG: hypothetical protein C0501_01305 [Isosphaera sp.]|nr:hypothetical protein [Isosphaera sp.]
MADGRAPTPADPPRPGPWTEIFRCFQVALDPRKLLVAAVAILVMSLMWWLLSVTFYYPAPDRNAAEYSNATLIKEYEGKTKAGGAAYTEDDYKQIGDRRYQADLEQWRVLDALAGPGGRLRTLPWQEYRGPNPFLFATDVLGGSAADRTNAITGFLSGSIPVLVEPLVKLLLPVAKLISPGVSPLTRLYLFLILLSNVVVWAFAGGVITRLAAVQLAGKGPISLGQAVRFVRNRYLAYLGAPLVPLVIIGACVLGLVLYGVLGLIPFVGDLFVLGLGLPVVIVGGAVMAVFLVGLVGYPLMYPTLSAEADQSDTFDALSRSINYVYQSPWHYLWYWLVAVVYGAAVTLFILFFTSLTVYVGKWAVGLTASTVWTDRKPEYLFVYAPESFGWKELLTKDSPYAVRGEWVGLDRNGKETADQNQAVRFVHAYKPVDLAAYDNARAGFYVYNSWGAYIVGFWVTLIFLLMLGFSYSFFWSAATMIYLLMRLRVDEAGLEEVVVDEDEPELPVAPPKPADVPPAAPAPAASLPVIPAPPAPPVPPPPLPPIPVVEDRPAPATLPFSPPADAAKPTYTAPEPPPRPADKDDKDAPPG